MKAYGKLAIGGLSVNVIINKHGFEVAQAGGGSPTFRDLSLVSSTLPGAKA